VGNLVGNLHLGERKTKNRLRHGTNSVGTVIGHIKEWKKAAEGRVAAVENKVAGFMGDRVEHVDNVKEE
jgi:hypothetical protein